MMRIAKWSVVLLVCVSLLAGGVALAYRFVINPRVMGELRTDPQGHRAAKVMIISLPGGKRIPVNYLREDDKVFAGSDGPWWRALCDGAPVTVEIRGETLNGYARVVEDDPGYKRDVFSRLRPTVPKWLPSWLDAKLVVVTLDPAAHDAASTKNRGG